MNLVALCAKFGFKTFMNDCLQNHLQLNCVVMTIQFNRNIYSSVNCLLRDRLLSNSSTFYKSDDMIQFQEIGLFCIWHRKIFKSLPKIEIVT